MDSPTGLFSYGLGKNASSALPPQIHHHQDGQLPTLTLCLVLPVWSRNATAGRAHELLGIIVWKPQRKMPGFLVYVVQPWDSACLLSAAL